MAMLTQVKVGSTTHDIAIPYAVCSTAAATAAKTADYTNFSLEAGSQIKVSFTYANTADSPTLSVNDTGAKPIVAYGTTGMTTGWKAGAVLDLTYNGTSWVITSFGGLADAKCSCLSGGLSKGTASGGGLSGGSLSGGGLSLGTATSPTVDISEVADTDTDETYHNVDLSVVDVADSKNTSTYPYYWRINAKSTGGGNTVTRAAITRATVERAAFSQDVIPANGTCIHTAGYLAAGSHSIIAPPLVTVELASGSLAATTLDAASTTATAADGTKTEYVMMKAAEYTNNIDLSGTSGNVPVITSPGYAPATKYAKNFSVPEGTTLTSYYNHGTTNSISNYGTTNSISNYGTTNSISNYGTILALSNSGTIGDSVSSSSSTTGLNGLYGLGTVYISAIGGATSTRTTSSRQVSTMVLKAGSSTTYAGAYIGTMNVNNYAAIGNMTVGTGASVSISSNAGTVKYLDWTLSESGTTLTFTY